MLIVESVIKGLFSFHDGAVILNLYLFVKLCVARYLSYIISLTQVDVNKHSETIVYTKIYDLCCYAP